LDFGHWPLAEIAQVCENQLKLVKSVDAHAKIAQYDLALFTFLFVPFALTTRLGIHKARQHLAVGKQICENQITSV
jgi:hypothetical protein